MGANNWEKDNPPAKVFGAEVDKVQQEWERFMDLEGYSDQTKKLKSAGFQKFVRWQFELEKPTKAKTTKTTTKKKGKVPKEGTEKPVLAETKPKRSRSKKKEEPKTEDSSASS